MIENSEVRPSTMEVFNLNVQLDEMLGDHRELESELAAGSELGKRYVDLTAKMRELFHPQQWEINRTEFIDLFMKRLELDIKLRGDELFERYFDLDIEIGRLMNRRQELENQLSDDEHEELVARLNNRPGADKQNGSAQRQTK